MILVSTTVDSREAAERLAGLLLERRLAACVQIVGPVSSLYRWRGAIEKAQEWVCTAKTSEQCYPEIEAFLADEHPYETPELIATPVTQVSAAYGDWVLSETSRTPS